ncbi:MAG: GNAT family N-acetyltransferase [Pseudomonadales bacterium]|nr:GNAT family N-acetyltransferase [Pseudomonadales bacterium]
MPEIRHLRESDFADLVAIYNYYIENTPITFDLDLYTTESRMPWFEQFREGSRHVCLVATEAGRVLGYANSATFRTKAAYQTSVESSVYLHPEATAKGLGSALYQALFEYLGSQPVHRIYAGVTLPNEASIALHTRFGFENCGLFQEVGFKFEKFWDVQWLQKSLHQDTK